jgi:hypothetical protein
MPVQAQRGGGGLFNPAGGSSALYCGLITSGKDQASIVQEAGWALGLFWMAQKILPPLSFNPQTIQPVARCYAIYTILAAQDFIVVR